MASNAAEFVTENDEGTFDFECPKTDGSCGPGVFGRGFTSTEWPTREQAETRGEQHLGEHETQEPMPELMEFRSVTDESTEES